MKILNDYDYESSNGSETFYDYFFNKVGIGADSNNPVTKFLELIIDCFYNNSNDLSNLLYDGVLSPNTANNLDIELRSNWLNKLGNDYDLPNKKGLIPLYKENEFLTNDEYNHYVYLRNCNLRTLNDWKTHFNKCFLTEEHSDISDRISYNNNNKELVLNYSDYDNLTEKLFMMSLFMDLCNYNLITYDINNYINIKSNDLKYPLDISLKGNKYLINNFFLISQSINFNYLNNDIRFTCSDSNIVELYTNDDINYNKDFIISFTFKTEYPKLVQIGFNNISKNKPTLLSGIELGLESKKDCIIKLVNDYEYYYIYKDDVLIRRYENSIYDEKVIPYIINNPNEEVHNYIKIDNYMSYELIDKSARQILLSSNSKYVVSGESFNLTIKLLNRHGVGISGETVIVTGSDGSSYTLNTNDEGIISKTISNINSDVTYTATYEDLTDTITVEKVAFIDYAVQGKHNNNYYLLHSENSTLIEEDAYKEFKGLTNIGNGHIYIGSTTAYSDFNCGNAWSITYDVISCTADFNFGSHNGTTNYGIYSQVLGIVGKTNFELKFVCDGNSIKAYVDDEYVTETSYVATGKSYLRINPTRANVSLKARNIRIKLL